MRSEKIFFLPVFAGIVAGVAGVSPLPLDGLQTFSLWVIIGILVGFFMRGDSEARRAGTLYGLFLTVAFLFSRFGGTSEKLAAYALFVAVLSLGEVVFGMIMVFFGASLKNFLRGSV